MGTVHAEVTLKNVADGIRARDGHIKEMDIRSETVTAVVDTGAMTLTITEELCQKLGLTITAQKIVRTASGQRLSCGLTEAVEIHWKDRSAVERPIVVPGAPVVLLGVTPLEVMDLVVDPVHLELMGAHDDGWTEWVLTA